MSSWFAIRSISRYLGCQGIRRYRPASRSCKRIPTRRDFIELAPAHTRAPDIRRPHAPRSVGRHRCSVTPAHGMAKGGTDDLWDSRNIQHAHHARRSDRQSITSAQSWFRSAREDFRTIGDLAAIDPDVQRKTALLIAESPAPDDTQRRHVDHPVYPRCSQPGGGSNMGQLSAENPHPPGSVLGGTKQPMQSIACLSTLFLRE
jgi:hypothetical protein